MVNKGEPVLYYLKDGRSEDSPEKSSSQFFLELSFLELSRRNSLKRNDTLRGWQALCNYQTQSRWLKLSVALFHKYPMRVLKQPWTVLQAAWYNLDCNCLSTVSELVKTGFDRYDSKIVSSPISGLAKTLIFTESESEMFSEIWPNFGSLKHASFFIWKFENKLLKACVLWMNDSRIHRNMKIAWNDSAIKLAC